MPVTSQQASPAEPPEPAPRLAAVPRATAAVGALPAVCDLAIYQGDDFWIKLIVTDTAGQAADLTGATAKAEIRATPGADEVAATFEPTIAANEITLYLASADSAILAGKLAWDCQTTDAAGFTSTLVRGAVTVEPEVTR
jgi:hypothetical protein